MKPYTIAALWQSFRDGVVPKGDIPHTHLRGLQASFYAGAGATLRMVAELQTGTIDDATANRLLVALDTEVREFIKTLPPKPTLQEGH